MPKSLVPPAVEEHEGWWPAAVENGHGDDAPGEQTAADAAEKRRAKTKTTGAIMTHQKSKGAF